MKPKMNSKNQYAIIDSPNMQDSSVYFTYTGPIDQYILRIMSDYLNKIINISDTSKKKLYIVLVELLQNVSKYSAEKKQLIEEKPSGIGSVIIADSHESIQFITGNIITKSDIEHIVDKCNIINSLTKEQLRKYKRKEMNRPFSEKDGAHIGLIQVALSSNSPIDFKIINVDEQFSYFYIAVSIKKDDEYLGVF
jgi:hypothetical protein